MSTLERLPDEIFIVIFQYSHDIYLLFRAFFGLNQRLNRILLDKQLCLFTHFLQINTYESNVGAYYQSVVFKTITEQLFTINTTTTDRLLQQCFQSLIAFHIREQYKQMKDYVELKIKHFKAIRESLIEQEMFNVDKDLRKAFEHLRKQIRSVTLEQIELLVLNRGACLEYNEHEQAGFYFADDFRDLFSSSNDHIRSFKRILAFQIIQTLKTLFISNPNLLKYPCYGGGYRFSIYEFLLYSIYHFDYYPHQTSSSLVHSKMYRASIDLILFATQYQKYLSDDENWISKIILTILNVASKSRIMKVNEIFIQTAQVEILNILLDEYLLGSTTVRDDDYTDRFRHILDGLVRSNRFDILLLVYRRYKPIRDFFNHPNNIRQNIMMMTRNELSRQFLYTFIDENKPFERWFMDEHMIFILLEKKERRLIDKLLKLSASFIHRFDHDGNDLLLFICLKVFGSRHRIVELLIRAGSDPQTRNFKGIRFSDALQLKRNRKLLCNLIKRKSVKVNDATRQITVTLKI